MEYVTQEDLDHQVTLARNLLINAMTSGDISPQIIAIYRRTYDLMQDDWTNRRQAVFRFFGGHCISRAERLSKWMELETKTATEEVAYDLEHGLQVIDKGVEINEYMGMITRKFTDFFYAYKNVYTGITTIYEANLQTADYVKVLSTGFREWFNEHPVSEQFLRRPPQSIVVDFLIERPDMLMLLNAIHELPPVKSQIQEDIDRPLAVEAIEFGLSFIPVVGNGISLYEAWTGRDLFGYQLTDLERGVLAASVLLPFAGRLVKGGRALYTEARLVQLYGRDAASWSRTIKASARAAEQRAPIRAIRTAEDAMRVGKRLEGQIAKEAASAIPKILHSPGNLPNTIENEIKVLWDTLAKKYTALGTLDEFALRRIIQKGTNVDHIKGQILEELAESHILPWLRSRHGGFALGLKVPSGKTLEFIPGHSIRTASGKAGRQITDGMVGYWDKEVFNILGIFEAKSGRKGARELTLTTKDVAKLSKADRNELRAFAKEIWAEQKEAAEQTGSAFTSTIEQVEKDILQDTSGQIRADIERLDELEDGTLSQIRIDGNIHPVKLRSVNRTKFFGVVPKGVRTSLLESEVKKEGFLFEAIAVPVHTRDLGKIAEEVKVLAETMLSKAP